MSERSGYHAGEFCWVDLSTGDVDAGIAFYRGLMGWSAVSAGPVEETGGYGFFTFKGKQVAGYGPAQDGAPLAWGSYVAVDDADATAAAISAAGGTVLVPVMDLPQDAGRMAVATDPSGAVFGIVQHGSHSGAELVNEVGTWTWNHLNTRDLAQARSFYGSVFGWTAEPSAGAPPDSPYLMWQVEGQRWEEGLGGVSQMGDADFPPEVPPHWLVYLAVGDADDAVAKTVSAGGSVMMPVVRIPVGRMAVLTDPQGAAFGIIEPDYSEGR